MREHRIGGYGKIYALGHRDIHELLLDPVIVQEKYDGSQFSFAWDEAGRLSCRSKGKTQYSPELNIDVNEVDGLFVNAVRHLLTIEAQPPNLWFRGEVISKPKHNTQVYDAVPDGFIVLFDVEVLNEFGETDEFLDSVFIRDFAQTIGVSAAIEITNIDGHLVNKDRIDGWLQMESSLGGPKIEGVVIKNYARSNLRSGRPLMGKYVSEEFKEVHSRSWKAGHQSGADIVAGIVMELNTEARFVKAVQHLRDNGDLDDSVKDIGPLMQEVKRDTIEEATDYIAQMLLDWALPKITRGLGQGLPQWYKDRLAFEPGPPLVVSNETMDDLLGRIEASEGIWFDEDILGPPLSERTPECCKREGT